MYLQNICHCGTTDYLCELVNVFAQFIFELKKHENELIELQLLDMNHEKIQSIFLWTQFSLVKVYAAKTYKRDCFRDKLFRAFN